MSAAKGNAFEERRCVAARGAEPVAPAGNSPPEQLLEAGFNSPGHKTALTYASSRFAGPAIVFNGSRQVAAINIDY